ncbi:MAG TPA: EAL domain-containing protein [Allosphingosinicella sp.]|jgi:diguanylate cyclase (GGDEF)-like protein/PAS domain S-box-containing protein|nr:EAL domain-containing protein [Allosphingosinicella sp.]
MKHVGARMLEAAVELGPEPLPPGQEPRESRGPWDRSADQLRRILDHIPQMVWSTRPDGHHDYYSRLWYEFTGVEEGSTDGEAWSRLFHPEDREPAWALWRHCLETGDRYQIEYRLRHHCGEYRWVLGRAWPERDPDGRIVRWYGTCTDIHEQKLAHAVIGQTEERYRLALCATQDAIWDWDLATDRILWNDALASVYGHALDGKASTADWWLSQVHPEDRTRIRESIERVIAGDGTTWAAEYRFRRRDGRFADVLDRGTVLRDESGRALRMIGALLDLSERKRADEALRASERLHRSVIEASADCIKIMSLDGRLEHMNSPGIALLELPDFESVRGETWSQLWPKSARRTVEEALRMAREGHLFRFTEFCPTAKGTPKWWDVVVTPMVDELGQVTRLLSIARDITFSREAADRLRRASEHDALTDLPNRRSFRSHLQAATLRAMESGGKVGLLLLDLDHFKHVNDTLGHLAGDHVLKTFADRLKGCVRTTDLVARLGGDEFAVILDGVKGSEDLLKAGASILERLDAPIRFDGRAIGAGASIGGALFPADASNANELFKNADTALYALKASGRGGTRMFHNYMREEAQKAASQLSLARIALSEKSVLPYYQQKVDLVTGRIRGFEALLRWHHPSRGLQLPDTVAEAFKDYELASKIGALMQDKIFADMVRWRRAGIDFGRVSINAAPAEFLRDDFAERLLARLSEHKLDEDLIEVEVTEHVFLDRGADYVGRALNVLNNHGVRISLDDFGTGYSSLSHLRDFPVDVVKIDKSFVARMVDQADIGSIVSAVLNLAASLDIEVVAEGIETEEQAELLRRKNCSLGQGFLFGRAVASDEVAVLLGR